MVVRKPIIFIDTNIWLDFYRSETEAALKLLSHVETILDRIVVTYQVEMEFKKNRQAVLLTSINKLEMPKAVSRPGIFSDAKAFKALQRNRKKAQELLQGMKIRLEKVFEKPAIYDPVYKICQRIFRKDDALNLLRENPTRRIIKRKAFKRFLLGYPPRKNEDVAIGDGLNWEWMVHCAERTKSDLIIVTRDSDYGVISNGKSYLNDHLKQEFSERVSPRRKVMLCTKLSEGLNAFKVPVSSQEKEEEDRQIEKSAKVALESPFASRSFADWSAKPVDPQYFDELSEKLKRWNTELSRASSLTAQEIYMNLLKAKGDETKSKG